MSVRNVLDDIQRAVDKGEGKPTDLIEKARGLLAKNDGDALALIAQFMTENYDLRVERRDLKGKLPKEGTVVLSAEEAAKWEALKGYDPKELSTKLEERDKLATEVKKASREKTLTEAATIAKLNPKVLARLAGDELAIEVLGEGETKTAVVKGADGKSVPLPDYAKTQWAEFGPALSMQPTPAANGTPWIPQPAGGSQGQPTDLVSKALEANKARATAPNALTAKTKG